MTDKYDAIERDVGIRVYLSDEPGFAGVMKARFSDFLVHEVNRDGIMARLSSLNPPNVDLEGDEQVGASSESKKRKRPDHPESEPSLSTLDALEASRSVLTTWVGEDSASKVIKMLQYWESHDGKEEEEEHFDGEDNNRTRSKFVLLPAVDTKEIRTAIHHWIRSDLLQYAVGDTYEGRIRIWHKRFEKETPNFGKFDRVGKPRTNRNKNSWPENRPDFLQFVLYKENIDTGTATKDILKRIKGQARIGYAGMKDKRGVTSQFITLYRKQPEDIASFNNSRNGGGGNSKYGNISVIRVGNFEYVDKELTLGMLQGNRFDVVLRNIDAEGDDLATKKRALEIASDAFKQNGFINYFGMQRFGKDHDTHTVGIEVLHNNFKGAIDMIMRPKTGEFPQTNDARKMWCNRFEGISDDISKRKEAERECAEKVLKQLGRFMTCEIVILHCLKREPLEYRKAFSHIPKHTRLMFLHAIQSVLWNKVASCRIEKLGKQVCVGDLVQTSDASEENGGSGTSGRKGKVVHVVKQEDIDACTYELTDVVLPLVGTKVEYPQNETFQMFESLLSEMEIDKKSFENVKDRELSLGGDYRKVICKPTDFGVTILEYNDPLQPLIQTDLMQCNDQEIILNESGSVVEKQSFLGMVVGFTLPPSSYATVALRELTKRPTSSEYQRQLQLNGPCEAKLV